jgi:hypothetical protein
MAERVQHTLYQVSTATALVEGDLPRRGASRYSNAESRMEHPAFAKQSSLVDETGIEPATSSLRTRKNL